MSRSKLSSRLAAQRVGKGASGRGNLLCGRTTIQNSGKISCCRVPAWQGAQMNSGSICDKQQQQQQQQQQQHQQQDEREPLFDPALQHALRACRYFKGEILPVKRFAPRVLLRAMSVFFGRAVLSKFVDCRCAFPPVFCLPGIDCTATLSEAFFRSVARFARVFCPSCYVCLRPWCDLYFGVVSGLPLKESCRRVAEEKTRMRSLGLFSNRQEGAVVAPHEPTPAPGRVRAVVGR